MTEDQLDARTERQAICQVEGIPQSEIDAILRKDPALFGIAVDEPVQGEIF